MARKNSPATKTIAYDPILRRPACILLQAAFATTTNNWDLEQFHADWLVFPTPDMQKFSVTEEQLKLLQGLKATDGSKPRHARGP